MVSLGNAKLFFAASVDFNILILVALILLWVISIIGSVVLFLRIRKQKKTK